MLRMSISAYGRSADWRVSSGAAVDGAEALAIMADWRPDVILLESVDASG